MASLKVLDLPVAVKLGDCFSLVATEAGQSPAGLKAKISTVNSTGAPLLGPRVVALDEGSWTYGPPS
jgi:hypothetical protein